MAEEDAVGEADEEATLHHAVEELEALLQNGWARDLLEVEMEDPEAIVGDIGLAASGATELRHDLEVAADRIAKFGGGKRNHRDGQREPSQLLHALAGIGDHDHLLGCRRDDLLSDERATGTLDEIEARIDLVGTIHRELWARLRRQFNDREAKIASEGLRRQRCPDTLNRQPLLRHTPRHRLDKEPCCRASAQPDRHSFVNQPCRCLACRSFSIFHAASQYIPDWAHTWYNRPMSELTLSDLRVHVAAVVPQIVALRHDLHAHPELSGSEERTAALVARWLTEAGIPHETGVGGSHGVVAVIEGGAGPGKTIALRGDMDALPILEENEVPYKSTNVGVMHACGHDGHTSCLMGAALVLNSVKEQLPGRIKLLFQPAEETVNGADRLVAAGAVDDVDHIVMLHGWPDLPPGQIGVKNGPAMASSDHYKIIIHGKGGHAAYPHTSVDPLLVGAHIVTALQSIVSREISPVQPVVLSVTQFHAGTARNIIAETAELAGTVRTLDRAVRDSIKERMERIISGICAAMRAEYTFTFTSGTPPVINDNPTVELIREVGRDVLGAENVVELGDPTMGAEDFAFYLERVPGAMFRLGTGCKYLLHTPKYDFGDASVEPGITMLAEVARRYLLAG